MTYDFTIDGRLVRVEAVQAVGRDGDPIEAIDLTAICEGRTKTHRMALHPKANKSAAQLEKNIEDQARKLAEVTAGHRQSQSLLERMFKPE